MKCICWELQLAINVKLTELKLKLGFFYTFFVLYYVHIYVCMHLYVIKILSKDFIIETVLYIYNKFVHSYNRKFVIYFVWYVAIYFLC